MRKPNALEDCLKRQIKHSGPISVHRYMAEALMHPKYGYYSNRDPLGEKGDFTTAPEISQIFGELVGLWLADRWEAAGRPNPVNLVELGPGRGTLMADILRAIRVLPEMHDAVQIHFVEANAALRQQQEKRIKPRDAQWHARLDEISDGPLLLVANEFFDALPIRQYVRTDKGWAERMVSIREDDPDAFMFCTGPAGAQAALIPEQLQDVAEGSLVEICPEAISLTGDIARRLKTAGGAALFIDYGYVQSAAGESLQAVRRHQYADVFHRPGECDLTAHVDFQRLSEAAKDCGVHVAGPVTQGAFLHALGIQVRAAILAQKANGRQRREINAAVRRLTADDMMGRLFKVMALLPDEDDVPGFSEIAGG